MEMSIDFTLTCANITERGGGVEGRLEKGSSIELGILYLKNLSQSLSY